MYKCGGVCSLDAQNADGSSQTKSCGIKARIFDLFKWNILRHPARKPDLLPSDNILECFDRNGDLFEMYDNMYLMCHKLF